MCVYVCVCVCVCVCMCVCVCKLPTHYSWTTVSLHKINVMKPPEECRLQSQKMTGKREIEREREVWCEKTKAGGEDRGKRKDRG